MSSIKDRLNRSIRFTNDVLIIQENHPEFAFSGFNEIVITTLQSPEIIVVSSSDETVELFYKYFLNTPVGNKWLCIVIKNLETDFFVITYIIQIQLKKEGNYGKKYNRIFR